MKDWLRRIWSGTRRDNEIPRTMPAKPSDPDAELAELAALIERGDASLEALQRIAKLVGQTSETK